MIHYIIQVIAFQLFFLIIYDVFLRKETFFNWNRAYLLVTAVLSVLLPFIKVAGFKNAISKDFIITLPELLSQTPNTIFLEEVVINGSNTSHSFLWYTTTVLIVGSTLAILFFLFRLFQIVKLAYQNSKHKEGYIYFVNMLKTSVAFSFFNYVFLGEKIKETEREQIIKHELVHVNQKHSWDLLFFELLRIVFWFNPLVYMYQNRMAELHEFIADSKAVKLNKKQYYESLLVQIFDTNQVSFINPFFKQSLIKKRIIMLQKSKSKQVQLIKYALLIPLVSGMLLYSSCSEEAVVPDVVEQELTLIEQIDALKVSFDAKGELSDAESEALHAMFIKASQNNTNEKYETQIVTEELGNEHPEILEAPFSVVDQAPVFPGCENGVSNEANKQCMSKKLNAFVAENFNTELANSLNLTGIVQIRVFFKINELGKIVDIQVRAKYPELEAEAQRVLNMIPDLIPGEHKGVKVKVPYFLPIKFQVNE
ncbi:M56 family metallopeptidase [Bizionia argentinensis JUB59]|uniref:M56 family metallopeptidase n=1 Tax=Bizionia argentinensis JUB59 TaxID=1046627 RepID=G2EAK0_9FLAO|nr:M56 family metallopeptidase [Bizionia argentinensis]EGV44588.1 M56 family metallopeptidase [Bizionia argentinensis JUB59]